ncbi:MAG: PfkB family carbohydrate kinase [Cyanobacteriota bacterium ELA615]
MTGLFVGLTTLDLIYLVKEFPQPNQKIVALEQIIASGGPATNAAITYSYLGNKSKLVTILGANSINHLIENDLTNYKVELVDLKKNQSSSAVISSILVKQSNGQRSVVSLNSTYNQLPSIDLPDDLLMGIDLILVDGHQIAITQKILQRQPIPVVLDGGSWKAGLEILLPHITYAICSADFFPPGCQTIEEVFAYLQFFSIANIAISQGEDPIIYYCKGAYGEIPIKKTKVVDTLGAGDVLHGAFCHYIQEYDFVSALQKASLIASKSCQSFGTRKWMDLF